MVSSRSSALTRSAAVVAFALSLAGCAPAANAALVELRDRFVAAGGSCSTGIRIDDSRAEAGFECDDGAKLYVFGSTVERADFIKSEIETNTDIRARTHIIVSKDEWLIVGTLASVVRVQPQLGGMISGRNAANP